MMVNLNFISAMIDNMAMRGRMAAELHLSENTHRAFVATMMLHGAEQPKPVGRKKVVVWRFRNVPLVVNPLIPDQSILVRPLHLLKTKNWVAKCLAEQKAAFDEFHAAQDMQPQVQPPPRVPGLPDEMDDVNKAVASEIFHKQVASVTDMLVNAATNCDDTKAAVIVKLKFSGELEIMSNADRFALDGILRACLIRVSQGD